MKKKLLALLLASAMVFSLAACGSNSDSKSSSSKSSSKSSSSKSFKIGAIMVGDENEGYTAAHIDGLKEACKELGIDTKNITFKYSIGEDQTCLDAAEQLADSGCNLVFANSFGHETYMLQAAKEYPDIDFAHATGNHARSANQKNFCNFFNNIYEARYVSGIVAGMKVKQLLDEKKLSADNYDSKGNVKIGYVGAYPYAEVVSGYTAFYLGIKSVVKNVVMSVQYTNSWFSITDEAQAAKALMSKGCVIIGQHADSTGAPSAVEEAFKSGNKNVFSVGYNVDMLKVAPDVALTSPQNNWAVAYKEIIETAMKGGKLKTDYCNGYSQGGVQISQLGTACAEGTQEAVDKAIADIKAGTLHVFDTSTFTCPAPKSGDKSYSVDSTGKVTHAFATDTNGDFVYDADEAIKDGYYQESTFQSAPSFLLHIDGITELNAKK
jgi:basic membrane protein A